MRSSGESSGSAGVVVRIMIVWSGSGGFFFGFITKASGELDEVEDEVVLDEEDEEEEEDEEDEEDEEEEEEEDEVDDEEVDEVEDDEDEEDEDEDDEVEDEVVDEEVEDELEEELEVELEVELEEELDDEEDVDSVVVSEPLMLGTVSLSIVSSSTTELSSTSELSSTAELSSGSQWSTMTALRGRRISLPTRSADTQQNPIAAATTTARYPMAANNAGTRWSYMK
eukprot:TRINITY_DN1460_c0_g3_i5.p1 TRINITY_DN1460_c0_g3~~TRINITY_DN1460_c0_g3_i5.p1  ORF type:complete len:226 (-),score=74.45 TRINITY_DN1460_c0_g3_i5:55-732(-)